VQQPAHGADPVAQALLCSGLPMPNLHRPNRGTTTLRANLSRAARRLAHVAELAASAAESTEPERGVDYLLGAREVLRDFLVGLKSK
jgi:hypothetical protein